MSTCETCAYWRRNNGDYRDEYIYLIESEELEALGRCCAANAEGRHSAIFMAVTITEGGSYPNAVREADLLTGKDFGCTQHRSVT